MNVYEIERIREIIKIFLKSIHLPMIDFESHQRELQKALGFKDPLTGKNCVDQIDEKLWWDNIMPVLNKISIDTADELQKETGGFYPKDTVLMNRGTGKIASVESLEELAREMGKLDPDVEPLVGPNGRFCWYRRKQKYSQAPPTRLLGMTLVLSHFLGFLDASGNHEMHEGALKAKERIINAYESGKALHPNYKQ